MSCLKLCQSPATPKAVLKPDYMYRDYCCSDIEHDEVRQVVKVGICPAEMDNEEEVTAEFT